MASAAATVSTLTTILPTGALLCRRRSSRASAPVGLLAPAAGFVPAAAFARGDDLGVRSFEGFAGLSRLDGPVTLGAALVLGRETLAFRPDGMETAFVPLLAPTVASRLSGVLARGVAFLLVSFAMSAPSSRTREA